MELGFALPKTLHLGVLRRRGLCKKKTLTFAMAGQLDNGYYIKFNRLMFDTNKEHLYDTIAHEVSHIAEFLLVDKSGHGRRFYKIFDRAQVIVKEMTT